MKNKSGSQFGSLNLRLLRGSLIVLVGFWHAVAMAQEAWVTKYNGPGNASDLGHSIAVDSSGNVYVTGWSTGSGTGYDYATIKYNTSGTQQWVARYNGPGNGDDHGDFIAIDGSGNVYVTGDSLGIGTGYDYATIKYNASGTQQWVARYNGDAGGNEQSGGIAVDAAGNVYVTGESLGIGTGYDYATVKYNASGAQQWVARYNGPGNGDDVGNAIAVDSSGNVYVTGWSPGSGTNYDYATIKYDSTGQQQWVARYDGPASGYDVAQAIAVDGSGNVYVTGISRSTVAGAYDYATIKYNTSGAQQWVARYNDGTDTLSQANAIAVDTSGNVYVTGQSGPGGNVDYATIKYNSSGTQQWVSRYKGPGNSDDIATGIAVDGYGNVFVTGSSTGSGTGYDNATVKYNSSGTELWVDRYNGPGNGTDTGCCVALDASGNAYVTGESTTLAGDTDYATIKYYSCWPACSTRHSKKSVAASERSWVSNRQRRPRSNSRAARMTAENGEFARFARTPKKRVAKN